MKRKVKRIYIAGKIGTDSEIEILEKIDKLCKDMGFETFLPHRDVGIATGIDDVGRIFNGDINIGLKNSDFVVAVLDGLHVGAGTAWELGFAYANGIPAVGIKTDESVSDALEELSSILIDSMPIVNSTEDLKKKLKEIYSLKSLY